VDAARDIAEFVTARRAKVTPDHALTPERSCRSPAPCTHGAAPDRFMVHVAMQQNDESGSPVTWGEHVSDEQYATAPST
jgi:hypothetical protein